MRQDDRNGICYFFIYDLRTIVDGYISHGHGLKQTKAGSTDLCRPPPPFHQGHKRSALWFVSGDHMLDLPAVSVLEKKNTSTCRSGSEIPKQRQHDSLTCSREMKFESSAMKRRS